MAQEKWKKDGHDINAFVFTDAIRTETIRICKQGLKARETMIWEAKFFRDFAPKYMSETVAAESEAEMKKISIFLFCWLVIL